MIRNYRRIFTNRAVPMPQTLRPEIPLVAISLMCISLRLKTNIWVGDIFV
ncbi:hypothetical protein [Acinetobacter stercoris]|nr:MULTISPECIES: hypothetical protein [Acinetobacter]